MPFYNLVVVALLLSLLLLLPLDGIDAKASMEERMRLVTEAIAATAGIPSTSSQHKETASRSCTCIDILWCSNDALT